MGQKIYLDTNLYIYFFEDNLIWAPRVEELLVDSLQKRIAIVASPLLLTELLVAPFRDNHSRLADTYQQLQTHINNLELVDLSPEISIIAAKIRAKYNLPTPDCIHIATAIESRVDYFYTSDQRLGKIQEIKIIKL